MWTKEDEKNEYGNVKEQYWKDGYIFLTVGYGPALVCGDYVFHKKGMFCKNDFDDSLIGVSNQSNSLGTLNDNEKDTAKLKSVRTIYSCPKPNRSMTDEDEFYIFNEYDVRLHCKLAWTRLMHVNNMTISEIENKLDIPLGSLRIVNDDAYKAKEKYIDNDKKENLFLKDKFWFQDNLLILKCGIVLEVLNDYNAGVINKTKCVSSVDIGHIISKTAYNDNLTHINCSDLDVNYIVDKLNNVVINVNEID